MPTEDSVGPPRSELLAGTLDGSDPDVKGPGDALVGRAIIRHQQDMGQGDFAVAGRTFLGQVEESLSVLFGQADDLLPFAMHDSRSRYQGYQEV